MAITPSASYSLTVRVAIRNRSGMLGRVTSAIGEAGGDIGAVDIVRSTTVSSTSLTPARSRACGRASRAWASSSRAAADAGGRSDPVRGRGDMTNGARSDLVGHFQAGLDVLKRYPMLVVPPLAVQVLIVVLGLIFLGGAAGMAAVGGLAGGVAGLVAGGTLLMLLGGLLSLITSGVVILMARDALAGRDPVLGEALNAVLARLVDVVLASLLLTVIVAIGMVFFIIPGLVAAFFLVFTLPAVLLDGQGAIDALRRSATLVKENVGPVLGLIVGAILAAVVSGIISRIFTLVPIIGHLAAAVVSGALISYVTVVAVRIYQSLPRRTAPADA